MSATHVLLFDRFSLSTAPRFAPWLRLFVLLSTVVGLALLVSAQRAEAAMHDWVVQGTVTARSGPVFAAGCLPSAVVGEPFRLDYRFDDTLPDLITSPTRGAYPSLFFWNLAFADVNDAAMGNSGGADVWNDDTASGGFNDRYAVTFLNLQTWPAPCAASITGLQLELLEAVATTPGATTSDAQPATPPLPGDFSTTRTVVLDADGSLLEMTITGFDMLGTLAAPVLPFATETLAGGAERWHFDTPCTDACWVDPPLADGFVYEAGGGARFTSIDDFPAGFGAPFDVWAEGDFVGTFGPGDAVDFGAYPGGGVTRFSVRGITPELDTADVQAFPLQLSLDTSPAEFTMTSLGSAAVPVLPGGGGALLLVGALGGLGARRLTPRHP